VEAPPEHALSKFHGVNSGYMGAIDPMQDLPRRPCGPANPPLAIAGIMARGIPIVSSLGSVIEGLLGAAGVFSRVGFPAQGAHFLSPPPRGGITWRVPTTKVRIQGAGQAETPHGP
jgi:hypothetical protein